MEKSGVELRTITYKVTTPDELLERFEDESKESDIVDYIIELLDNRSAFIVKHRYCVQDSNKLTLEQLAIIFNICPQRVHQIENSAIERLKGYFERVKMIDSFKDSIRF